MSHHQGLVRDFHRVTDLPIDRPHSKAEARLRARLILEEAVELAEVYLGADLSGLKQFARWTAESATMRSPIPSVSKRKEIAKETGDVLYVVFGGAVELGFDALQAMEEVHVSNMTKLGPDDRPIKDPGGKVLKGPGYRPPDLSRL